MAAFCRERDLCAPHFFEWKRKLSQAAVRPFVAVQVVEASQPVPSQAIEVRLAGGRSVMVGPGFDAGHLRAVLSALETRA